jgi:hypothetical protein
MAVAPDSSRVGRFDRLWGTTSTRRQVVPADGLPGRSAECWKPVCPVNDVAVLDLGW